MKIQYVKILLLSLLLVGSCSKDLGNYDYTDINELTFNSISGEYTVRTAIDTLRISPEIATTITHRDETQLEHLWIVQRAVRVWDTIGYSQNLEYPIMLDPADYNLYYRVLDKKTGVTWIANSKIKVTTAYSKGLLIIGENDQGNAEAEMLTMLGDTVHVRNILANSGLPVLKKPVGFIHTGGTDASTKLWLMTETGSYFLDRAKLVGDPVNVFQRLLYVSDVLEPATLNPVVYAPQIITAAGATSSSIYRVVLTQAGDIFSNAPLLSGGDYYNNPVNRLENDMDVRIPASPYLMYSIANMSSVVWYDSQKSRFLNYSGLASAGTSTVLKDEDSDVFPWNQPAGRTLVYAENTRNTDNGSTHGNSFALMKDLDNTHHIYKFYANGTNPAKRAAYKIKPIATDIDKASFFAFSSHRTVLFYAVGNKLYAYDYNVDKEKLYSFPEMGTDEISMIKFDTQIDHLTNSLYIATYNSTEKGTLRRFRVGMDPNFVEIVLQPNSSWTNMIKIKNISWRAVN